MLSLSVVPPFYVVADRIKWRLAKKAPRVLEPVETAGARPKSRRSNLRDGPRLDELDVNAFLGDAESPSESLREIGRGALCVLLRQRAPFFTAAKHVGAGVPPNVIASSGKMQVMTHFPGFPKWEASAPDSSRRRRSRASAGGEGEEVNT